VTHGFSASEVSSTAAVDNLRTAGLLHVPLSEWIRCDPKVCGALWRRYYGEQTGIIAVEVYAHSGDGYSCYLYRPGTGEQVRGPSAYVSETVDDVRTAADAMLWVEVLRPGMRAASAARMGTGTGRWADGDAAYTDRVRG